VKIERGTDPANANGVRKPRGQGLDVGDLLGRETADDTSSVGDVLPRPIAHAVADSARRRISLISAAAARRALRSADSATMRSQSRSRAASAQPPPKSTSAPRSTWPASGCTHPAPGPWQPSSQTQTSPAQQYRAWPQPLAAPPDLAQEAARLATAPPHASRS
jgi:hypothetical protein